MFRLNVLQNQWLILAYLGGLGLLLMFALAYQALWRAGDRDHVRPAEPALGVWARMPLLLMLIIVATGVYGVIYLVWMWRSPPNW